MSPPLYIAFELSHSPLLRLPELEAEAASLSVADDLSDEALGMALQELRTAAESAPQRGEEGGGPGLREGTPGR